MTYPLSTNRNISIGVDINGWLVRTLGTPASMSHMSLSLQPATSELSTLRSSLRRFFSDVDEPVDDWLLIATELFTNAIAAAPLATAIEVKVEVKPSQIDLRVIDTGQGLDLDPKAVVPTSDARGRGLMMVNALAGEFNVSVEAGRTIVTASRWRNDTASTSADGAGSTPSTRHSDSQSR